MKLQSLENDVGFTRGKGGASKSCIAVYDDVPTKDVEKKLRSAEEEDPKLVIFMTNKSKIEMMRIVGDKNVIDVEDAGIPAAMVLLCVCYQIFNLIFPRRYCQLLGLIQMIVLNEDYVGPKSTRFLELISDEKSESNRMTDITNSQKAGKQVLVSGKKRESREDADFELSDIEEDENNIRNVKRIRKPKKPIDV